MRSWPIPTLLRQGLLGVMAVGAVLITLSSLAYFDPHEVAPFVLEHLPVRPLWLTSLRVHVSAALVGFPLCIALMTRAVQRRPRLHRGLGRIAASVVLGFLVPAGAVLAFDAKGGSVVTVGFLLSAGILAWSFVRGIVAVRRGQIAAHRHAMNHAFAQMSVAVTSRAMIIGFDILGVDQGVAYAVALWVPVLGSALVVEVSARRFVLLSAVKGILREHSVLWLGRSRALAHGVARPRR